MPDPVQTDTPLAEDLDKVIGRLTEFFHDPTSLSRLERVLINAAQAVIPTIMGFLLKAGSTLGVALAEGIVEAEEDNSAAFGKIAALAIRDVFGVDVSPSAFGRRGDRGARAGESLNIGRAVIRTVAGGDAPIEPSLAPAEQFTSNMVQIALEGWLEGWIFEWVTSLGGWLQGVETFAELDDTLIQALGLGRLSRRALGPIVDAKVSTPAEWFVNLQYRPKLLSAAEAVRQVLRGTKDRAWLDSELGRQGYSGERIQMLLDGQRKFLALADLEWAVTQKLISPDIVKEQLAAQGYTPDDIARHLFILNEQRLAVHRRRLADAAVSAFVSRDLSDFEFEQVLDETIPNVDEQVEISAQAHLRRLWTRRSLSEGDAREAVQRNLISRADYVRRLEAMGYSREDRVVKELLLEAHINDAREAQRRREELEAERARRELAQAAELAKRKADVEAQRARQRRAPLGPLEGFVVRGLIAIHDYAARLAEQYDPDVVDLFVSDAEGKRQAYLADQGRREALALKARELDLSLAQLERAVRDGLLGPGEYEAQLRERGFDAAEAALLKRMVEGDLEEREDARRRREAAEEPAQRAGLSLAQEERLVRRGVRTLSEYRAAVERAGFDPADVAALTRLLELELADDAAAREARGRSVAGAPERQLSLGQFEALVKAGARTLDELRAFLRAQRYAPEAADGILRLLQLELDELATQRALRATIEGDLARRGLSLAQSERAVIEGVWDLKRFVAWLAEQGYGTDAQSVLVALLLIDIDRLATKG